MATTSILVLGAGELGNAMLHSLAKHPNRSNTTIAVLLRPATARSSDESKKKHVDGLRSLGIDVVEGDVVQQSKEELAKIFSAYEVVINCFGIGAPGGTQMKVAEAAISSGIRRYFVRYLCQFFVSMLMTM
jgi:saccharopine dehydrogenase-like NADP-dependent oxidoreductase